MTDYYVIARPDGTDLRTGTVAFVVGATLRAPESAPFRLARSPIEVVALGAFDRLSHAPWRVFAVEAPRREWDHAAAMDGFPHLLGHEIVVVEEVALADVLGCDPPARARELTAALDGTRPVLEDRELPSLVHQFLDRCAANQLDVELDAVRGLPIRCVTRIDGPLARTLSWLVREAAMVREDADNFAMCDATGAVQRYLETAETCARQFATDAACDPGPAQMVQAHLHWKLVDPLLAAPPQPLVNVFEPLAELVMGGVVLLGWTDEACIAMRMQWQSADPCNTGPRSVVY